MADQSGATLMTGGKVKRAMNTLELRNKYNKYLENQNINGGDIIPFEKWVAKNYPQQAIVSGTGQ